MYCLATDGGPNVHLYLTAKNIATIVEAFTRNTPRRLTCMWDRRITIRGDGVTVEDRERGRKATLRLTTEDAATLATALTTATERVLTTSACMIQRNTAQCTKIPPPVDWKRLARSEGRGIGWRRPP